MPAHILSKPGPLTEDEREIIQLHPLLGERILGPIARLEAGTRQPSMALLQRLAKALKVKVTELLE